MRRWVSAAAGLAIVVVLVFVVWRVLLAAYDWFLGLEKDRAVAIAALFGIVLAPVISYFTTRSVERRRGAEAATREQKVKLYEEFIAFFMRMLNLGKAEKPLEEDEMVKVFADLTPRLISYASNEVIHQWRVFRALYRDGHQPTPEQMFTTFESLLKAMRKDLGHGTFSLRKGDILGLFINDIDDYL